MGRVKDKKLPPAAAELRRRAEEQLCEEVGRAHPLGSGKESQRLLHELQVHQIELEMQNAELLKARDELEAALEKYTDLYDFAPVAYFTLDRNGTIRSANLIGSALVGVERSRLIGRRFAQLVSTETGAAFSAFLGRVFTSSAKETCEVTLLKEGNSTLFLQVEGMAATAAQECRIALVDVTERKHGEEALRRAKEAAEATAMVKSQFLANMSHELRTPMAGILGMLELALQEELAPTPREYLETTLTSTRALLRILNDILHMAKIEAGKLTIEEKPFSLRECIAEAADIITPEIRRRGLAFAVSATDDMPDRVVGDQTRLRQILINLIGNAVKFTEEGKVAMRVTAERTTSAGKREFTFAVTDTGIGIPDDKKELLFRAFSQVDASHSRRHGGTGLGLAISREIVELMGGTISFTSAEGEGSTFSFTIPLAVAGAESASRDLPRPTTTTAPTGEKMPRLLLVEDDEVIRKVFGLMLQRANYHLDFAENGLQAVEMWEAGGYDLVLMDVQMPRLNGFEATCIIREKELERGGHTPIVAMTAHARAEDKESCLVAGMDAYVSKPIDFQKTLQMLAEIIKEKAEG